MGKYSLVHQTLYHLHLRSEKEYLQNKIALEAHTHTHTHADHAAPVCFRCRAGSLRSTRGFTRVDDESSSMLMGMQLPTASCWPAAPEGLSCGLLSRVESTWL